MNTYIVYRQADRKTITTRLKLTTLMRRLRKIYDKRFVVANVRSLAEQAWRGLSVRPGRDPQVPREQQARLYHQISRSQGKVSK